LRASLKTFLILSFGEELKVRSKIKYRFLEMPLMLKNCKTNISGQQGGNNAISMVNNGRMK
jgi:hypothetical protein